MNSRLSSDSRLGSRPTRAVIDLDAIARNYGVLRARAGERSVYPVVKANAYGHGAVAVARRLEAEGAGRFAVAIAEEGVELRRGGVSGEILILGGAYPSDLPLHRGYGLLPALQDLEQARQFSEAASRGKARLSVHIKLDTGMGRLGFRTEGVAALSELLRRSPGLKVAGVFTQLASSAKAEPDPTRRQIEVLSAGLQILREAGISPGTVHVANSGGLLAHSEALFDAVRPGIALYGVLPSETLPDPGLAPAMELETRILSVKSVPAGTALGYSGAFVTERASRIAVLPIGYHDGFRRSFTGRASVLVGGGRAPVVGWVSMDLSLIDVTEVRANPGDRVVLMGRLGRESVTPWDLARAAGTNPYDILSGISSRVPRVYETSEAAD